MQNLIDIARHRFDEWVWAPGERGGARRRRRGMGLVRLVYAVVRDLIGGELNLRAMSLVYTTLLSVVPLLAVSFSVLKAFGVHNQIAPLLRDFLEPFGQQGVDLADDVVGFVENVNVGVLGGVGLVLLIYTVVSLMHKIEASLNFVWHVDVLRSFGHRASGFLSVILVGPVLVFSAVGLTTAIAATSVARRVLDLPPLGSLVTGASKLLPYLLVWAAFLLVYLYVPNTRVRLRPAALGGLTAGVLWQSGNWAFAEFVASANRNTAIYAGFAVGILLLIWIYLDWLVLLVGAKVAYYAQNPHYVSRLEPRFLLSNRMKEVLAVTILYHVGVNHQHHRPPWTVEGLSDELCIPVEPVVYVVSLLEEQGYLQGTADDPRRYLPGRDLGTVEIRALLLAVRRAEESRFLGEERIAMPEPVLEVARRVSAAVEGVLGATSVRELIPPPASNGAERSGEA